MDSTASTKYRRVKKSILHLCRKSNIHTLEKMTNCTFLSIEDQASILALAKAGKSYTAITAQVGCSYSSVRQIELRGKVKFRPCNRGLQSKLSKTAQRFIIRKTSTGCFTARQLEDAYALFLTVRRIQQILRATPDLCWARAV